MRDANEEAMEGAGSALGSALHETAKEKGWILMGTLFRLCDGPMPRAGMMVGLGPTASQVEEIGAKALAVCATEVAANALAIAIQAGEECGVNIESVLVKVVTEATKGRVMAEVAPINSAEDDE